MLIAPKGELVPTILCIFYLTSLNGIYFKQWYAQLYKLYNILQQHHYHTITLQKEKTYLLLWGHTLPYPKDGLVQPKHILRA